MLSGKPGWELRAERSRRSTQDERWEHDVSSV